MRFALLVFFSLALMTADHRMQYLDSVRTFISVFVYPVQYAVSIPSSATSWVGENIQSRESLLENNEKLVSKNLFLQVQMQKYVSLEIENMRLRHLLDASKRLTDKVLTAELLAVDLDPFSHKVLINKGLRHNTFRGQPILDSEGVYGQVVEVLPITSSVMLLTDPGHSLPVQVNRSGLRTIAQGTGSTSKLVLLHIPNNGDIKEGDLLVTSGLGGVFPSGYPVARVTLFKPVSGQAFATVEAEPLAKLDKSREVLMVWKEVEGMEPLIKEKAEGGPSQNIENEDTHIDEKLETNRAEQVNG